jgi:hypothetical protein
VSNETVVAFYNPEIFVEGVKEMYESLMSVPQRVSEVILSIKNNCLIKSSLSIAMSVSNSTTCLKKY